MSKALPLLSLFLAGLALTACGNKTPLEPPPGSTVIVNEQGETERTGPDRPFILDPLL